MTDTIRRRFRVLLAGSVVSLALLAWIPSALAADSSVQGYGGSGGQVQSQVEGGNPGTSTSGSLPFTGLDLGLLIAGGALLLVVGGVIRRITRSAAS